MNKLYPGQAHVATRLHKIRNPQLHATGIDQNHASDTHNSDLMTIQPRQAPKMHKTTISFNQPSQRANSQHRVLTVQGSRPSQTINTDAKTDIRTVVEVTPQSAQSSRTTKVEVSTKVFVSDEKARTQLHKMSNSDLDTLIKEVMQCRYDEYARVPAVDLSKHFVSNLKWKGRRAVSSLSRNRSKNTTRTIDCQELLQTASLSSSFPARKHKHSKSLRRPAVSKTIDVHINLQDAKRALQKYNNSGLYKDRLRISISPSPQPREYGAHTNVGVIGRRITPY